MHALYRTVAMREPEEKRHIVLRCNRQPGAVYASFLPMLPMNNQSMGYAPIILLAEDNENDAALLQIALEECGVRHVLVTTEDGQDAMAYLRGDFPYTNRSLYPLPRLIILDLDMPRMSGFDVLAWLASQPDLRHLPAI